VTEAVAVTAEATTEATKQEDDQEDDEYESDRHDLSPVERAWPNRYLPFWPRLDKQQKIVDDNGDTPAKKHPEEPRMGGVPDQVEGCEPNNDDDKDGKMDKETAQRRFCEPELLRR
jgi:hypothetical protein